jgi:hypothetical protein
MTQRQHYHYMDVIALRYFFNCILASNYTLIERLVWLSWKYQESRPPKRSYVRCLLNMLFKTSGWNMQY